MDIDLLSKMVKELILDDDKVVLPGLGCFVAEIVPASFSDKGYTINPPYRKLYFRSRPDEGDALIDFYAKSNALDYEVAERIIKDFLNELKSVLHVKKTVVFPGLGRLRATKENNLFFIADEDLDIYPAGFGLEPISLKTHQETPEELSAAVVGLKAILEEQPEPEPAVDPEFQSVSEPEQLEPEQEPESEPISEPDSVLEPVPEPEPVEEPVPDPMPDLEPEPKPIPDPKPEPIPASKVKTGRAGVKILLTILIVMAVLLIAYMAIGRICPDWIDRFLYSPEELQILNHKL